MAPRASVARLGAMFLLLAMTTSQAHAGLFDNLFGNIFKNIQKEIQTTMEKTTNMINSVLSGVGGLPDGASRSDLKFVNIIDGAFSRKNGINVTGVPRDMDWKINGDNAIGAIFAGRGGVSVSVSGNGKVSITRGGNVKPAPTATPAPSVAPEASPSPSGAPASPSPSQQPSLVQAVDKLMENWGEFMKSDIWDIQDENVKEFQNDNELPDNVQGSSDDETMVGRGTRVVNGIFFAESLASGSEFSVKFFYDNEQNFYCSGSFIAYPWVLTAAHCGVVVGDQVRVGGRLLRSGYAATVDEVFVHPDFKRNTLRNDIAVIRLSGLESLEILEQNGVRMARLNKKKNFPREGSRFVLSAHGSAYPDGAGFSDTIMATRQTVHKDRKCANEITQGELKDEADHLCAGDGARSTSCVGDSGAGLWRYVTRRKEGKIVQQFFEIVGVVSFGEVTDESLCPLGPPTVYQEVSVNYDWIAEVVGGRKNLA